MTSANNESVNHGEVKLWIAEQLTGELCEQILVDLLDGWGAGVKEKLKSPLQIVDKLDDSDIISEGKYDKLISFFQRRRNAKAADKLADMQKNMKGPVQAHWTHGRVKVWIADNLTETLCEQIIVELMDGLGAAEKEKLTTQNKIVERLDSFGIIEDKNYSKVIEFFRNRMDKQKADKLQEIQKEMTH